MTNWSLFVIYITDREENSYEGVTRKRNDKKGNCGKIDVYKQKRICAMKENVLNINTVVNEFLCTAKTIQF